MVHFNGSFKTGGPRLPQLAVYSAYECFVKELKRYEGHTLVPLERLKTANRKSGTVGDVDLRLKERTVEAVEIKFGMAVESRHVSDAIEKIKAADVRRYYILATGGVRPADTAAIAEQIRTFHRSNGCEIIVNGILETLRYYLRLIGSVDEFVAQYVDHLASDDDVSYEHRIEWNRISRESRRRVTVVKPATSARSQVMAAIRSRDTRPERVVRSIAHRMGFRFRLHRRDLPASPDIVFPRFKAVILRAWLLLAPPLVYRRAKATSHEQGILDRKFARNRHRDLGDRRSLRRLGWRVLVLWECQLSNTEKVQRLIRELLTPD